MPVRVRLANWLSWNNSPVTAYIFCQETSIVASSMMPSPTVRRLTLHPFAALTAFSTPAVIATVAAAFFAGALFFATGFTSAVAPPCKARCNATDACICASVGGNDLSKSASPARPQARRTVSVLTPPSEQICSIVRADADGCPVSAFVFELSMCCGQVHVFVRVRCPHKDTLTT